MWTEDNTEGFTQDELNAINSALVHLKADHPDLEDYSLNDLVNNYWQSGMDSVSIYFCVHTALTLPEGPPLLKGPNE